MIALTHNDGFFTSVGQGFGFALSSILLAILGFLARVITKMAKDMRGLKNAVVTQPVTEFNPSPPPALLDQVANVTKIVERHDEALTELRDNVECLLVDSRENNGSTSRDALKRIEIAVGTTPLPRH